MDRLEELWPELRRRFRPHTLVLNLDNGSENQSHRTQFMKRLVEFVSTQYLNRELAYYPPYHSKYNPIEHVWGILEQSWNGEVLDSRQKGVDLAGDMTWNEKPPVVTSLPTVYPTGVSLTKTEMMKYEKKICRCPGLEKWFIWIPCME